METKIQFKGFKPIFKGIPPFMDFKGGFGYYGVLLEEEVSGKLQCHLCGKLSLNIAKHLFHKHKTISPSEYKIKTGLNLTAPLMAESTRKKIKNNFLNLSESKKKEVIKRLRRLNRELHTSGTKKQRKNKASLQTNNRYGTCPEQVRHQFWEIYNKLGRLPRYTELTERLHYIIEDRFGSYEEAVVVWGVPRKEYKEHVAKGRRKAQEVRAENDYFPKYTKEEVEKQYLDFFSLNKRFPTWGEVQQYGMPGRFVFARVFKCSKSDLEKSLLLSKK